MEDQLVCIITCHRVRGAIIESIPLAALPASSPSACLSSLFVGDLRALVQDTAVYFTRALKDSDRLL